MVLSEFRGNATGLVLAQGPKQEAGPKDRWLHIFLDGLILNGHSYLCLNSDLELLVIDVHGLAYRLANG